MIRSRLLPLAAALSLALAAGPVLAQAIDPGDQARLQAQVDALGATIRGGDLAGAIDVVPPRLLDAVSARFGVPREQLPSAMREAIASGLEGVTITGYGMDLAAAEAHVAPGDGRTWLLIPTWTEMAIEGAGRFRTESLTLALEDDGEWYLVRIEDAPQIALLREVYPEFAEVNFPPEVTTPVP